MTPKTSDSIVHAQASGEPHPTPGQSDTPTSQAGGINAILPSTRSIRGRFSKAAPYILATSTLLGTGCEQGEIDTNKSYCLQHGCDAGNDGATVGEGGMLNVGGSAGTNNSGNLDGGSSANGGSGGSGNPDDSAAHGGSGGTNTPDANTGGTSGTQNPDSGLLDATPDSPQNPNQDAQTQCGPFETPCGPICCTSSQFCTPAGYCNNCPPHTSSCGTGVCLNLDYADDHCGGCGNTCNSWETCWEKICM